MANSNSKRWKSFFLISCCFQFTQLAHGEGSHITTTDRSKWSKKIGSANLVFLLDCSKNVGLEVIQSYKVFVKEVCERIGINASGMNFGLLECGVVSQDQNGIIKTFETVKELDETLEGIVPGSGKCELGRAIKDVGQETFAGLPNTAPKVLVIILAGQTGDDAAKEAFKLKQQGVRIIALGIGPQVNMAKFGRIAENPLYAFKVPMFEYLLSMSSTVEGFVNHAIKPNYDINKTGVASEDNETVEDFSSSAVKVGQLQQHYPGQEQHSSFEDHSIHPGVQRPVSKPSTVHAEDVSVQSGENPKGGQALTTTATVGSSPKDQERNISSPDGGHLEPSHEGCAAAGSTSCNLTGSVLQNKSAVNGSSTTGSPDQGGESHGKGVTGCPHLTKAQLLTIPVIPVQTLALNNLPDMLQSLVGNVVTSDPFPNVQQQLTVNQSAVIQGSSQLRKGESESPLSSIQIPQRDNKKADNNSQTSTNSSIARKGREQPTSGQDLVNQTKLPRARPTVPMPAPTFVPVPVPSPQITSKLKTVHLHYDNASIKINQSTPNKSNKSATFLVKQNWRNPVAFQNNLPSPPLNSTHKTDESQNKPTLLSSATESSGGNRTNVKENHDSSTESNHDPSPVVLCQLICGSLCCSNNAPIPTSKPTIKPKSTRPTKVLPTTKGTSSPKPNPPLDVILAPASAAWKYPPYSTEPPGLPSLEVPFLPTVPGSVPPSLPTAASLKSSPDDSKDPVLVGQCQDFHPDCSYFVMNGLCDQPSPYKDIFNVRELCMLSCGVCRRYIKHGDDITFDVRDKAKPAEDLGFPEYSNKNLRRDIH